MALELPYRYITGLPRQAQEEIRRDFEEVKIAIDASVSAFIVVAEDGSGNFLTIKEACDSIPAGSGATIIVKPGTYSEAGLGTINIGSKRIRITSSSGGVYSAVSTPRQIITVHSFTGLTGSSAPMLVLDGIDIKTASSNTSVLVTGGHLFLHNSDVSLGFVAFLGNNDVVADNSEFRLGNGSTASSGRVRAVDCYVELTAGTYSTLGGLYFSGGTFVNGTATIVAEQFVLIGAFLPGSSTQSKTLTVTTSTNGTIVFSNNYCISQHSSSIFSGPYGMSCVFTSRTITATDNFNHAAMSLTATDSGVISGTYGAALAGDVTIDGQNWTGNFTVYHYQFFTIGADLPTPVVIAADRSVLTITGHARSAGPTQTNPFISLTGADNIVLVTKQPTAWASNYSDSGSGNSINALSPSGAAGGDLSGTYPNPAVVDDSHNHTAGTIPADVVYDADIVNMLESGDAAGGDLSGTYPNPAVVDDSHNHTASTLPATVVYDADLAAAFAPTAWTPGVTGSGLNTGTQVDVDGWYHRVGDFVKAHGRITFGTTGFNNGTGAYTFDLPFQMDSTYYGASGTGVTRHVLGTWTIRDDSAGDVYSGICRAVSAGGTTFIMNVSAGGSVGELVPMTMAVEDEFFFDLAYYAV